MKKLSLILAVSLLCGAFSGCSYRIDRHTVEPLPTEEPLPAEESEPTPTPDPGLDGTELSEEERLNRVLLSFSREEQQYRSADGSAVLLDYGCTVPCVTIPGREESAEAVNAALTAMKDEFDNAPDNEDIAPGIEGMKKAAQEHYDELNTDSAPELWTPYAKDRSVSVSRGDAAVISLIFDDCSDMGGAHGFTFRFGASYDTETGAALGFDDLSLNPQALRDFCTQYVTELIRSGSYADAGFEENYAEVIKGIPDGKQWYLSSRGLVLVANPYDIAPYAAGRFDFCIPYSKLEGLLENRYLPLSRSAVQGGMEGAIENESSRSREALLSLERDGGEGEVFLLWAEHTVYDVRLCETSYDPHTGGFEAGRELLFAGRMNHGEFFRVTAYIPEIIPDLMISWSLPDGSRQDLLISQSGKDGSLLLIDPISLELLPVNMTDTLPASFDLDSDGEYEELTLTRNEELGETRYTLRLLDDLTVTSVETRLTDIDAVWFTDLEHDSTAEILISGREKDGAAAIYLFTLTDGVRIAGFDAASDPFPPETPDDGSGEASGDEKEKKDDKSEEKKNGERRAAPAPSAEGMLNALSEKGFLMLRSFPFLGGQAAQGLITVNEGSTLVFSEENAYWEFVGDDLQRRLGKELTAKNEKDEDVVLEVDAVITLLGTNGTDKLYIRSSEGELLTLSLAENKTDAEGEEEKIVWMIGGEKEAEALLAIGEEETGETPAE